MRFGTALVVLMAAACAPRSAAHDAGGRPHEPGDSPRDGSDASLPEPRPRASAAESAWPPPIARSRSTTVAEGPLSAPASVAASAASSAGTGARKRSAKVTPIGMHIGGGPNDDVTKEPLRRSVAPHLEELAACYEASPTGKTTDVGVDLLVPHAGGRAQVSHPRSTVPGADTLLACVVRVFETTDFLPPRTGRTVVSYSLRFSP